MKKGFLAIVISFLLLACGDGNVVVQVDPDIQLEKDSIAIAEFMIEKGYEDYQTTPAGVRYIILETGSGEPIDESDFVTFDYTGMLLSDTIFDTSVKSVGDSIRAHFLEDSVGLADKSLHEIFLSSFWEERSYSPYEITYSSSGWTIEGQFINGFTDGVSVTFNKMNVGGRAIIAIPSGLAYGTNGSGALIPPNTPIAFELMPVEVIKQ